MTHLTESIPVPTPTTPVRDLGSVQTVRGSYTGDSPGLTTGGLFRDSSRKWQYDGVLNYFHGAHNIKTSYGVIWVDRRSIQHGPQGSPGQVRGVVLYTRNGVPDQFQTQNTPFDYQSSMWQNYFYFQDKWQVTRKLVANLGVRWDRYLSHYPEQGNDGIGAIRRPHSLRRQNSSRSSTIGSRDWGSSTICSATGRRL